MSCAHRNWHLLLLGTWLFRARATLLCLLTLYFSVALRAHDTLQSTTIGTLQGDQLVLECRILAEAVWPLAENVGGYSTFQPEEFDSVRPQWAEAARTFFSVSSGDRPLRLIRSSAALDGDFLLLRSEFAVSGQSGPLSIRADYLRRMAPESHATIVVSNAAGAQLGSALLPWANPTLEIAATGTEGARPRPRPVEFLQLGVHHILSGYDHLLFLAALLVACRRVGSMLAIATCFTIAHSITLALAALDLVTPSARLVEPMIAATIIIVAVENLVRRGEPRGRWAITLCFGLVHGFGFAGALRETGLGTGYAIVGPLLGFNVGVELAQVAVIAVFLPVLLAMRKRYALFTQYGAAGISVFVALAGLYWLVQRT